MFFRADNSAASFTDLKCVLVMFDGAVSIHCGKVPLIRELYAFFRSAAVLAVAAKNAGIVTKRNCPCRGISIDIIFLSEGLCRADINAGAAADAVIIVELGLAPVFRGDYARLGWEAGCKTRRKNRNDSFP